MHSFGGGVGVYRDHQVGLSRRKKEVKIIHLKHGGCFCLPLSPIGGAAERERYLKT